MCFCRRPPRSDKFHSLLASIAFAPCYIQPPTVFLLDYRAVVVPLCACTCKCIALLGRTRFYQVPTSALHSSKRCKRVQQFTQLPLVLLALPNEWHYFGPDSSSNPQPPMVDVAHRLIWNQSFGSRLTTAADFHMRTSAAAKSCHSGTRWPDC